MSTIEQATKRLAQLRNAGVDTVPAADVDASSSDQAALPLRVVKELESQATPQAAQNSNGVEAKAEAPEFGIPTTAKTANGLATVEIDLERLGANGYLTPQAIRSRLGEEFRVIKRPLLNNASGKSAAPVRNANRIMVTSALPGEGKTFVSLNLAMSLAGELDTEVLLVDADASRPALLERLGVPPSKGLLDLLVDPELRLQDVVLNTNVDRLSVLPSGSQQSHATELLASDGMAMLLERLAAENPRRVVLFDTPPLLVASEARVLATQMGQIVMVIAADDTPQGTVAEALATLENCPVVFTLLNRVAPSDRGHYYGSYGSYSQ